MGNATFKKMGGLTSYKKLRTATKKVSKTGNIPSGGKASMGQKVVAHGVNATTAGVKNINKFGNKAITAGKKLGISDTTTKTLRKHSGKIGTGIVAGGALGVAGAVSARNKAKEDKKFKNRAKKFIGMR